jgi:hypothetical protein
LIARITKEMTMTSDQETYTCYGVNMPMLDRRVQVLFSADQYEALKRLARAESRSVGAVIREAVDTRLDPDRAKRMAAWERLMERAKAHPTPAIEDWEAVKDSFERDEYLDQIP